MIDREAPIFIAGHRGMVGSAILRRFTAAGCTRLLLRSHSELDLRNQAAVREFFTATRPRYVVLAAARVGGILANSENQADFLLENLEIQNNVIGESFRSGVEKFCFLGSSCIYPGDAPQPIREESLLCGRLEPTNEGYALAKLAGYRLCWHLSRQRGFRTVSLMPCNLYGTGDNYDLHGGHVFPALIRRFAEAAASGVESVTLWGSGRPRREFMHVDDLASAVWLAMNEIEDPDILNAGSGTEISIRDLAYKIAAAAGFSGEIRWDASKPDGMFRKCMDSSRLRAQGWLPEIDLDTGISRTLAEFRSANVRRG